MNILILLTPKHNIEFAYENATLRQVLEKMEYHRFSAIPIISKDGIFVGTITEGELLWGIINEYDLSLKEAENILISEIKRHRDNVPVHINNDVSDLFDVAINQNFVPVLDDNDIFIGIVTRQDILKYFYQKTK